VSDSDKRDGGPMRYQRHQRSRRLQDEDPKISSLKSSDGKNVNFLCVNEPVFIKIYYNRNLLLNILH